MHDYIFNRQGQPITVLEWGILHEDDSYVHIGHDYIGGMELSTVWLGIRHGIDPEPDIFETMTFGGPVDAQIWARYKTQEEAAEGHIVLYHLFCDGRVLIEAAKRIADGRKRHGMVRWARGVRRHYLKSLVVE